MGWPTYIRFFEDTVREISYSVYDKVSTNDNSELTPWSFGGRFNHLSERRWHQALLLSCWRKPSRRRQWGSTLLHLYFTRLPYSLSRHTCREWAETASNVGTYWDSIMLNVLHFTSSGSHHVKLSFYISSKYFRHATTCHPQCLLWGWGWHWE